MALLARISNWFYEPPSVYDPVDPDRAFDELRATIAARRAALVEHPLYDAVNTLPRLRQFMAIHVFPVWDFMCLAKRLQRDFTSMDALWRPPREPALARFINGVIHGEESDTGPEGEATSHCELYIAAMDEVGARTATIKNFLDLIAENTTFEDAMVIANVPHSARAFMTNTLQTVMTGDTVEVLASFLFGREDLIPDMFERLLPRWRASRNAKQFAYYVQRHIELDGDDHGPAARRALITLAGRDAKAWRRARQSAEVAIDARIALWNTVHASL